MITPRHVCLLVLLLSPTAAVYAAGETGTLRWSNGDQLPGSLLDGEGETLQWSSDLFATPLLLDAKQVAAVDFFDSDLRKTAEAFRIVMRNGDVIYGRLVKVSDTEVSVESVRHGPMTLDRSAVRGWRRLETPALVYRGPNGMSGWQKPRKPQAAAGWSETRDGELVTRQVGANMYHPFDWPDQVEIELTLQAEQLPRFQIGFDSMPAKSIRIETWDDELVLVDGDDFEPVLTLSREKTRAVPLRIYWSRRERVLTVYSKTGAQLATMTGTAPDDSAQPGLFLENKGAQLLLAHLRVNKWNGQPPREVRDGQSRIHLIDGTVIYARIASYGENDPQILVDGRAEPIGMEQVDSIHLVDESSELFSDALVQATYFDGARITGDLEKIAGGTLFLKTDYSRQPVVARLLGCRKLQFRRQQVADGEGLDQLVFEGGLLHGTLTGGQTPATAVQWRPIGGINSSPLVPNSQARFIRPGRAGEPSFDSNFYDDVLFLDNQDIVPCRVEAIDDEFVYLETAFAEYDRLRHDRVRAVELGSGGKLEQVPFTDPAWELKTADKKAFLRQADRVTFQGPATFGHLNLLHGDEIKFDLTRDRQTTGRFAISPFANDLKSATGAITLTFYCEANQIWFMGAQGQGGLFQEGQSRRVNAKARFRILAQAGQIRVLIDDNPIHSGTIEATKRAGLGLVLSTEPMENFGGHTGSMTVSNFEIGRVSGIVTARYVDAEVKERALTIPRFRRQNPATHILLSQNGDLLRGKLAAVKSEAIVFQSLLDEFSFPRERVAAIVWLPKERLKDETGETAADQPRLEPAVDAPKGSPDPSQTPAIRVILVGGEILVMSPEKMTAGRLFGFSEALGRCAVPVAAIRELQVGGFAPLEDSQRYADWIPRPAPEPRFARDASGNGDGDFPAAASALLGKVAEDFEVKLLGGDMFRLSAHKDKVVVLDFWATWCGPCVRSMPDYLAALNELNSANVLFVGLNQGENAATVTQFLETRQWSSFVVGLDMDEAIAEKFQVDGIPHTVIIGKGGVIEWIHVGYRDGAEQELRDTVEKLLAGQPVRDAD